MKMKLNLNNTIPFIAIVTVILLVSSPAVAVPSDASYISTDAYSTTPNVELGNVVAGIGQAVYASIYTFGGVDGSSIPIDTTASEFADADSWFVASISQSGFESYLQRAPSPVDAPDGLSFHVSYASTSMSNTAATSAAIDAASSIETEYGVTLDLVTIDLASKSFGFWANGSSTATVESAVASDVTDLGSVGLSTLLDASVITSAPVFWSGYGARTLSNSDVVQFGAGWVDADGLTDEGNNEYKLSSNNIFGGSVSPNTQYDGLSRVTFTVPYPIAPVAGGINPTPSNPLPHVTGVAEWDLNHPISYYGIGAQTDLSLQFKVKADEGFPNIKSKFSVNQTKLTSDGILEGTFDLENTGTEIAEDIEVNLPLGPDFGKILKDDRTILQIKDAYELNPSYSSDFNFSMDVTGVGSINEQFLSFAGWYQDATTDTVVQWDSSTTPFVLFDGSVTVNAVSTNTHVEIKTTDGFPQFVLDELQNVKDAINAATIVTLEDLRSVINDNLPGAMSNAVNATKNTFYEETPVFTADFGDFTLNNQTYAISADETRTFYFLSANVSSLAVDATTSLSFRIADVPIEQNTFQFIDLEYEENTYNFGTSELTLPNATVISSAENWFDVMQYLFQRNGFDGRPLSYGYESEVQFGLDAFSTDSFHSNQYVSQGAFVTYNNTEDYTFYSFSNGQNLQIADNEALVSATVELDKSVYYPGENKTATINLENLGDIAAENVKVHLYEASLGRNWRFDRRDKVTTIDVGTLNTGSANAQSLSHSFEANSFVGYTPVYAYVEFDSDLGEGATPLKDYLDLGITEYEATAETHHIVFSSLTGALLLPQPGDVGLNPTLKEANVEISKTTGTPDSNQEFDVSFTLENTGQAYTEVNFYQLYDADDLELIGSSDVATAIKQTPAPGSDYGYAFYSGINLDVDDTVSITLSFKLKSDSATITPAFAYFSTPGDSSLGGTIDTGASTTVSGSSSLLELAAGSQAQQDSQKSANEDSSSSSYSASSSVGASVNTNLNTDGGDTVDGIGFIGYDALSYLALMAVPLTLASFYKKRR